ncbi:GGDEF domain-containing protein [Rhodoferax sp.]|uniref:GGDEF domain-containing protein n=1 Tax=Rhodoferax sp. TaxID=50421 RepID=UPI00284F929A|nr:GGDEF domain-containing protein [Rhodoferax sp.]MDR3368654.1 GGDEF domain-containing protein [Rhodoferax sp.]
MSVIGDKDINTLWGCCQRGVDHVLGTGKAMRIRTTQFLLATLLMLASVGVLYFMRTVGIENMGDVDTWAAFSCGGLVVIYVLIRSGFSLRMADPSLAFVQMLYAIACNAAAFDIAGHGRGVTLPILSVILMFGMFGLSMRQVVFVALYGLILFGVAAGYALRHLSTDEPVELFAAYIFMVFVVLSATTVLTWRLQQMSAYMRKQKNQLALAFDKIQQIATRDELTGTANRRFMLEKMRDEVQRADRTSLPLLFAIIDIDHFKQINDSYGHHGGDRALQAFASLVQGAIRGNDTLARWGGEEFVVLLTDTDMSVGLVCLERIRAQVAEADIAVGDKHFKLTVSIGVTQYCRGDTAENAMARADAALYSAKAQGRNQIVCSEALS